MLHQKIVESPFKQKYGNFIGGEWREPVAGRYFDNTTPVTGGVLPGGSLRCRRYRAGARRRPCRS